MTSKYPPCSCILKRAARCKSPVFLCPPACVPSPPHPQCPEMSGFVRSFQSYPRFHHQPHLPTRLTAISIVQPTGHSRHSPCNRTFFASAVTTQYPPQSSRSEFRFGARSEFRLQAVFFVIAAISNLHYPNVRKCPVLSGLLNAIPAITINPLYQQDLQQFPSRSRPDIPDIRPVAGPFSSPL